MNMKQTTKLLTLALMVVAATFTSCREEDMIRVSTQNLWFGLDAQTDTLDITSNCDWTVIRNDTASWYTITPLEGTKNGSLLVTVTALEDADYRGSTFVISSPGGHVRRTIFVSQNKLDFDGMINKVFGVMELEHWNTDYFEQIIEDSYKHKIYDPYDTSTGYLMYFLADGTGVQRDHHNDTAVYYAFVYDYNPITQILHVEFETINDEEEKYDANVLTASDSLYRFMHEYRAHWWERADMRKIGTIQPNERAFLRRAATKRKGQGGIFQF
jgi:hypothetical protein